MNVKKLKENRGITLVELIVAFAILTIVFGSIITFLVTTTNLFRSSNNETNIQNEAQLTNNRIHDMLVDSAGVSYYVGSNTAVFKDPAGSENADSKVLQIYNWADENGASSDKKVIIYTITFNGTSQKLTYKSYEYEPGTASSGTSGTSSSTSSGNDEELLAQYVTGFSVVLYDSSKGTENTVKENQAYYKIDFSLNGKSYSTENTVTLRNNAKINTDPYNVPASVPYTSTVLGVSVTPSSAQVVQGGNIDFSAVVTGINHPSQDVTWNIASATDNNTKFETTDSHTMRLTLGSNEQSQEIRVTATSVQDKTVVSSASVVSASYLSGYVLTASSDGFQDKKLNASLSITGKKLIKSKFDSQVVPGSFKLTDKDGNTVSDCSITVSGTSTSSDQNIVYDLVIDATNAAFDAQRNYSITLEYPTGVTHTAATMSFTTPQKPPEAHPITAIKIVRTDTSRGGSGNLWRGETASFKVYVKRGDGEWVTPSADGKCGNIKWSIGGDNNYTNYITTSGMSSETMQMSVSKSSKALKYGSEKNLTVSVSVNDTAVTPNVKHTSDPMAINIPKVIITYFGMKKVTYNDNEYTYDNYISSRKVNNTTKEYANSLTTTLTFTGLVLNANELSSYITWKNNNSASVVNEDIQSNIYEIVVNPKKTDSDKELWLALGDQFTTKNSWNDAYDYGVTSDLKYIVSNCNLSYNYIYYMSDNYYIPYKESGTYYTCDGIQYTIYDYGLSLSFNGNIYYLTINDGWYYSSKG